jgi:hypothetical protein
VKKGCYVIPSRKFRIYFGFFIAAQAGFFSCFANAAGESDGNLESRNLVSDDTIDPTNQLPEEVLEYIFALAENPSVQHVSHRWQAIASSDSLQNEFDSSRQRQSQSVIAKRIGIYLRDLLAAFKQNLSSSEIAPHLELLLIDLNRLRGSVSIKGVPSIRLLVSAIQALKSEEASIGLSQENLSQEELAQFAPSRVLDYVFKRCLNSPRNSKDKFKVLHIFIKGLNHINFVGFFDEKALQEEMYSIAQGSPEYASANRAKALADVFEYFYSSRVQSIFHRTPGRWHAEPILLPRISDHFDSDGSYVGKYFEVERAFISILNSNRLSWKGRLAGLLEEQKLRTKLWFSVDSPFRILETARWVLNNLRIINRRNLRGLDHSKVYRAAEWSAKMLPRLNNPELEFQILLSMRNELENHPNFPMDSLFRVIVWYEQRFFAERLASLQEEIRIIQNLDDKEKQKELLLNSKTNMAFQFYPLRFEIIRHYFDFVQAIIPDKTRKNLLGNMIVARVNTPVTNVLSEILVNGEIYKIDYSEQIQYVLSKLSEEDDREFLVGMFDRLAVALNLTQEDFERIATQAKKLLPGLDFTSWWSRLSSNPGLGIKSEWISAFEKGNFTLGKRKSPEEDEKQPNPIGQPGPDEDENEGSEKDPKRKKTL